MWKEKYKSIYQISLNQAVGFQVLENIKDKNYSNLCKTMTQSVMPVTCYLKLQIHNNLTFKLQILSRATKGKQQSPTERK